jgi:aromatase
MRSGNAAEGPISSADIQRLLITKTGADPAIFEDASGLSIGELGIDSLAVLELQAVVESEYGFEVPEEARSMTTAEIAAHVNSQAARI